MAQQSTNNPASQTFLGRINTATNATNNRDLYLKLFSGEMFTGFQRETIARDLVMKRTLTNGKSLQFIYTGRTSAEYHTPGNSILGNSDKTPPVAEKTITVDDLLISSAFVYELDETLAHYELRGEISKKIGYALAQKYDRLIFRAIAKGARQASPVSLTNFVEPGGTQIQVGAGSNADDALDSTKLVTAFYDAAAALDEKGVSDDGRVAVLNPRQYYSLIQEAGSNGLINRDVQGTALQSGNGVIEIAGIKIFKSMNVPFFSKYGTKYAPASSPSAATDLDTVDPGNTGSFVSEAIETATTVTGNNYGPRQNYGAASNFANTCGLIFQREAAGVVETIGPQVQVTSGDVSVVYQGDVILGRLAMGADYVNPAACVELFAGTTTKPAAFS
ncbi:MAG: hypothetical protein CMJ41_07760 [Phycisphaerae bacterium]|nr:hypothetical protein [Phycisphaerae bacterium]|tara:strand:+ start:2960 stop:4129 length:1170 start_codon:yes stop_codon:yes gene_type:complete